MMGQALNKRLGTSGLNMSQIVLETLKKNTTVAELMTIPEQDSWIYSDGISLVCSCFVMAIYKHGGLLDGYDI